MRICGVMIKTLTLLAALVLGAGSLKADVFVHDYYRSNGTHVESHWRTSPNNTTSDNYSSGAYNPHKW